MTLVLTFAAVGTSCGGSKPTAEATSAATPTTTPTTTVTERPLTPYEKSMAKLGAKLGAELRAIGDANATSSRIHQAKNLTRARRNLRSAARVLQRLKPPKSIQSDHRLLTKGVLEFADELSGVIARLRAGNPGALKPIPTLRGVKDMQRASLAIARKGYRISVIGNAEAPRGAPPPVGHTNYALLYADAKVHKTRISVLHKWPKPPYQTYRSGAATCYEWFDKPVALYSLCFEDGVLVDKAIT